ncbi:MAG: dephospho-CoA kinase [Gallionella sp.]
MSLCIGLTGGIGCGKTTVAEMFAGFGAGVVDTDAISHQVTQADGQAMQSIKAALGNDYITQDGALNRTLVRELIFSNPSQKIILEQILHPLILKLAMSQLQQLDHTPYNLLVVPLLVENAQFQQLAQRILVVDCREETQIDRVTRRNSMKASDVQSILTQQSSRTERLKTADDVIYNDDDIVSLSKQVEILHKRYAENQ